MSLRKPYGIAHYAVIHHLACISLLISLSTAVDATPHAILAIIVPATTMLIMSHLHVASLQPMLDPL